MVSVGFFIGIGLKILGMEGAFLLGVLAGIFNIIPYFGPIIGLAPAFIFALLHSPWTALYVVVLFTVVNQLEAIWLAPRIFSTELGLHPITVIYLILFGGQIFGLLGMIFAIPIGATCIALLRSIYEIYFNNPKGATDIKIEDDGCFE
jgi:predicted PurR-regulated permease PerM